MTTNVRDPRSIVTPDAFSVSEELLGLPLASPRRRLAAILIDLLVVATLTALTESIQVFVWGLIGFFFLQMAFRKNDTQTQVGQVTSWVFRGATGCLGLGVLIVVVMVGFGSMLGEDAVEDAVRGLAEGAVEAERQAEAAAAALEGGDAAPPDLAALTDTMSGAGIVDALVALRAAPDTVEPVTGVRVARDEWEDAVLVRAGEVFAGDRIGELQAELAEAEIDLVTLESRLEELREERSSGLSGIAELGRDLVDQLGSAFGIWSIYFTVTLVLLKGRTVGKLLLRMRVLRLNGEPFTWWSALERSGGYAAGLATGLLGFVQIFWDRNRQCVHDKIVGSVVVLDGRAAEAGSVQEVWDSGPDSPIREPS